jgi:hypothetical protein
MLEQNTNARDHADRTAASVSSALDMGVVSGMRNLACSVEPAWGEFKNLLALLGA